MGAPTERQLEYIDSLRLQAKLSILQLGDIHSFDDASAAIERLHGMIPLRDKTRQAVFAALRQTDFTKADMYLACGIESLSNGSCANEADGHRALRWINGELTERNTPREPMGLCEAFDSLEQVCAEQRGEPVHVEETPAPEPPAPKKPRGRPCWTPPKEQPEEVKAPEKVRTPRRAPGRPLSAHPLVVAIMAAFPSATVSVRGA